ncbi:MAG: flavin reductase family protein [Sulfolobales archaeon]|nr:flavin reductase family protein [Sulfolobales archaeon]MCX8208528.1 flavin reductase family protein [Sulfolobales archaeon]MDW8010801.1 flavin reductase family protein [Sulfolobales archaeon]
MRYLNPSDALELVPQPLAIVTAGDPDRPWERGGMAAAWVSRVSWTPPLVAVAMARERYTYRLVRKYGGFVVHVVSRRFLKMALEVFGSLSGAAVDKFEVAGVKPARAEAVTAPVIPGAPVVIECRFVGEYEVGDHVLVVGEAVRAYSQPGEEPVVWYDSSAAEIRKLTG